MFYVLIILLLIYIYTSRNSAEKFRNYQSYYNFLNDREEPYIEPKFEQINYMDYLSAEKYFNLYYK